MSYKEKWWYPKITDSEWIKETRKEHPEETVDKDDYFVRPESIAQTLEWDCYESLKLENKK